MGWLINKPSSTIARAFSTFSLLVTKTVPSVAGVWQPGTSFGSIPGARVQVGTFSGADHFEAVVEAPQFEGKSLIEQHKMVYAALDGLIGGAMHALALKTRVLRA